MGCGESAARPALPPLLRNQETPPPKTPPAARLLAPPPVQASAGLRYSAPLATAGRSWYIGGDLSFRDKQYADATNEATTPSLTKLNMQIGLQGDSWKVELWGRNHNNKDGPSAA